MCLEEVEWLISGRRFRNVIIKKEEELEKNVETLFSDGIIPI